MDKIKWIGIAALVLVAAFSLRELWPKERVVHTPPEIVTVYDTVAVDSFIPVEVPVPVPGPEITRTVTVTEVDTVEVTPELPSIFGATRIRMAGMEWGDTLSIQGFQLEPDSTGSLLRREWRADYFITGPLEAIAVDSVPPVVTFASFEEEDPDRCPSLLRIVPLPCDPGVTVGAMYLLTPPGSFPLSAYGLADVAFGSKRIRVGLLVTSDLHSFLTVGYRF